MGYGFKIMVEGDYACYTRPELKVERVESPILVNVKIGTLISCKILAVRNIILFSPV